MGRAWRDEQKFSDQKRRAAQGRARAERGVGAVIPLQTVEGGANGHFLPLRGGHGPSTRGHSVAC